MAVWETDFFRATKKMYKRRPIGHTKNMEHLGLIKKSSLSTGLFVMGIITSIVAIVLYFIGLNSATPSLFIPTIIVAAIGAVMYFVSAHAENGWIRMFSAAFIAAHAVFITLAIIGL